MSCSRYHRKGVLVLSKGLSIVLGLRQGRFTVQPGLMSSVMDGKVIPRVDIGFYVGTILWALLALIWDPCPCGLPEISWGRAARHASKEA